jgi:hypothetical protein
MGQTRDFQTRAEVEKGLARIAKVIQEIMKWK